VQPDVLVARDRFRLPHGALNPVRYKSVTKVNFVAPFVTAAWGVWVRTKTGHGNAVPSGATHPFGLSMMLKLQACSSTA
jgi:hypothetical protein